nr:thiamine diphosphokinase [Ignavibacteria bacterium]
KGEIISLLALPIAAGITTKGLKYELKNDILEFGVREGSLNESESDTVSIEYKTGSLLLFKKHFIK